MVAIAAAKEGIDMVSVHDSFGCLAPQRRHCCLTPIGSFLSVPVSRKGIKAQDAGADDYANGELVTARIATTVSIYGPSRI